MTIKLFNKSKCPDEILRPIIQAAARRVKGVETNVVAKVLGPAKGNQGTAYRDFAVHAWHLSRKRLVGQARWKLTATNGGWLELHIPRQHPSDNHLAAAEDFLALCVHEWSHIRDFQATRRGVELPEQHGGRHCDRPQERRAFSAMRRAKERPYSQTAEKAILALGLWLESENPI